MPNQTSKGFKERSILPFATPCANRRKDFTKNMEMASVLYLAESNREKGESHLLRKTDEKIVFLTEAYYPIWLIPYNAANLVFDGLDLASHTLYYDKTPDIEIFNKDIRRKQRTTVAYTAALSRNLDYFRNFKRKEKIQIDGLITDPDLKKDLKNYFPSMKQVRKPLTNSVVLTPTIENRETRANIKQLSNLQRRINKDIENMDASMKLLNATTARRIKAIREEIRETQEEYHTRIKKTENRSTKRIWKIQSQYNRKITRTSKRYNRRLLRLNRSQTKLKKTLKHLKREAKRCESKLQSNRRRNRKQAETQWTHKLKKTKKKLTTITREIKTNLKRIRHIENAQKRELTEQKIKCLSRLESANKTFRDLQGSKEAEIIMKRQEIATLEDVTRYITRSMQQMVQKKKASIIEFEKITMPRGKRTRRLVYTPFYLVRYEKGEKKRYLLYPPSVIGDMGILTKMKGALGATKVKALLQSRSEPIATFLNQLPAHLEKKPMLEKTVTETGIRNSILLKKQLRVGVKKGLKELENQHWISKNELQTISKILYIYSSSMDRQIKTIVIPENEQLRCLAH